jgi:hypothetical protein
MQDFPHIDASLAEFMLHLYVHKVSRSMTTTTPPPEKKCAAIVHAHAALMAPLVPKLSALQHLTPASYDPQRFSFPDPSQKLAQHRPKTYRIVLHSDDRCAGTTTNATFDLGDLAGACGLTENLDVGPTFYLSCESATPAVLEILAQGFPHQPESFDSSSRGPTQLLGVAAGAANAALAASGTPFTLRSVPCGRVTIRLVTRDAGDLQAALDADASIRWHAVLGIVPEA